MIRSLLVLVSVAALLPIPTLGETYSVRPDGAGDFPTIQAAIDAAVDDDIIELTHGTFAGDGNRDIDFLGKPITVRSQSGDPATCIIDCEGSEEVSHRGFHFHSGEGNESVLGGISIINGWVAFDPWVGGGAILCEVGSAPSIQNCNFHENHGSALYYRNQSDARLVDCRFTENVGRNGGGVYCVEGDHSIIRCQFIENSAQHFGGGLRGHAARFDIRDCLFTGNVAECGAAIDMIYSCTADVEGCLIEGNIALESFWSAVINLHGMVTGNFVDCTFANNSTGSGGYVVVTSKVSHGILNGCTFWGNSTPSGTIVFFGESDGRVDNTIIAGSTAGRAMYIGHVLSLSCCDIYGNAGGDWVGGLEVYLGINGNISEDPLFCDPENGDFTISSDSPCAPFSPPNEECDLIGAWPVGCDSPTATMEATWGQIKTRFRW